MLSAGTTARILEGLQEWPNGLEFGGRDVVRDPETGALVSLAEPEEAVLFEDAELRPSVRTINAKPGETPPLRVIKVPFSKIADSVQ